MWPATVQASYQAVEHSPNVPDLFDHRILGRKITQVSGNNALGLKFGQGRASNDKKLDELAPAESRGPFRNV